MNGEIYTPSHWIVVKVASLYYLEHKSQKEIADMLSLSKTTVSRLLKQAEQERLVYTVFNETYAKLLAMSNTICQKYGLKDTQIVLADEKFIEYEELKKKVALEGARYIQRIIGNDDVLGVSWGRTVNYFINYLNPCLKKNPTFVSLHGPAVFGEVRIDLDETLRRLNMAFGKKLYAIPSYGIMPNKKSMQIAVNDRQLQTARQLFDHITISITGVGVWYPVQDSPIATALTPKAINELKKAQICADLCFRFIDINGNECDTPLKDQTVSIPIKDYKKIPTKVIVASGAYKAHAIHIILKAGLCDVLIIDSKLAEELLQSENYNYLI